MKVAKFIELLNGDLSGEYQATVQYIQHQGVMQSKMRDELRIHAFEELAHASTLARMINILGGTPTITLNQVQVSDCEETMLQQDLDGEDGAIAHYKERVEQAAEMGDSSITRQLQSILDDEEIHAKDLHKALGK